MNDFKSEPIIVSPSLSISEIIGILQHNNVYEVFLQKEEKVSTITVREILKVSDIHRKASSLMFFIPKLSPEDTVGKAAKLVDDYRLRALPIVSGKTIEGAVTTRSLSQALTSIRMFRQVKISKIMTRKPITIDKGKSISTARRLMLKNGIDHLPVLDSGYLCGILLSNHIVSTLFPRKSLERGAFLSEPSGHLDIKVSGLMDPNVLVCDPRERACAVLNGMMMWKNSYQIVHHMREIQGIVTLGTLQLS